MLAKRCRKRSKTGQISIRCFRFRRVPRPIRDAFLYPSTEEIDWGCTTDGGDIDDGLMASQIIVEESGTAGGLATGEEAYTLLDNRRLRNLILDELYELSSFCKMRSIELSQEDETRDQTGSSSCEGAVNLGWVARAARRTRAGRWRRELPAKRAECGRRELSVGGAS